MTVVGTSHGVVRAAGHAGWPLLPTLPKPTAPDVEPTAAPERSAPPAQPVDDLVALAAALNGPGRLVYVDWRQEHAA